MKTSHSNHETSWHESLTCKQTIIRQIHRTSNIQRRTSNGSAHWTFGVRSALFGVFPGLKESSLVIAIVLSTIALGGLSRAEDANYVAHEWGTFTSVQGADGVLLEWNPLETTKLPRFVYDWSKPGMNRLPAGLNPGSKSVCVTLQRMETPVIYFYSDQERTVDVTVRFPQGLITEWYPQAHEIGPSAFPPNKFAAALDGLVQQAGVMPRIRFASMFGKKGIPDSRIHWKQVRILPAAMHADISGLLPRDSSGNHYFAARETDAAFVQVQSNDRSKPGPEHEKLLFYRGVANFKTPLNATISANETDVFLRNTGADELRHLFVFAVRRGQGKFVYEKSVPAGQHVNVQVEPDRDLLPSGELVERINERMRQALVQEGLYPREAEAMVKTWRASWFEEDGLRVFYLLPRKWTDETLPLTLEPKPREVVRVMVGRAEIIPPAAEWELLKQIVRCADPDPANRQQAIVKVKELGLGRFLQPAVQRVLGGRPNREFSRLAWELVNATTKQVDDKTLAAK